MAGDISSTMSQSSTSSAPSSSRILYDIPCKVCQDHSSGKHYGIFACDGCAGFFKRSVRRSRQYACKSKRGGTCIVDKTHRNQCRACRLAKCLGAGMNKDAVQHERGPRNSTLRRQLAQMLKESPSMGAPSQLSSHQVPVPLSLAPLPPLSEEVTCEVAAQLLFMNVRWARQVGAFSALSLYDRLILLVESWRELFVLGASVMLPPLTSLTNAPGTRGFRSAVEGVAMITPDEHELACLRAIVLFQPRNRLSDPRAVAALQENAQTVLSKYVTMVYPDKPFRLRNLMMLLPLLKLVPASSIEELFFRKTIGDIPIERIISDMYRKEEKES
ncbi:nuclear receptor subfamily 2 group E member tailless [Arctopsyche grandis]|uniref:nuclear receptor subfamily 2 group E member tailless n=1 Tax=Arctopsyche grandis TaxID=121162 RepID=UPI00406D65C0